MRTDYHTHTERGPYTVEWLREFLKVAEQQGISDYGVSEHGYRFKQTQHLFDNPWTAARRTEDMDEYLQMVLDARAQGLNVKFGIELDYIPGRNDAMGEFIKQYPFDYVIGSIHWLGDFGFDLAENLATWEQWELKDAYNRYFEIMIELAESRLFDIVGHPDVIKVFGHEPDDQEFLNNWYERLAKIYKANDQVIEVSTAGLRKPVGKLYPAPNFLRACFEQNVPIALSSDAHRPEDIGADYDQAIAYIRAAGYTQIVTFTQRERSFAPLT